MAPLVEIPLNSYRYHFRRLTWREEVRLNFLPNVDQRKVILAGTRIDAGFKMTLKSPMQTLR